MLRRRNVAASPRRSASETWQIIIKLLVDTLEKSPHLRRTDIEHALAAGARAGQLLVAGGHLDRQPLTLVAGQLHCEIRTVSGRDALGLDESLDPVPGIADATTYMLYLPTPSPLDRVVADVVADQSHLSHGSPPSPAASAETAGATPLVDLDALRRLVVPK